MKKIIISLVFLMVSFYANAQEMKKGFTYLETGKYQQAETFFEKILVDFPKNKTAKLCYGRAVGLLGKSEEAIVIFHELLKRYPNDFEVKLNYAESLLWDKQYEKAKNYYQKLIKEDDKSFSALLGYANTLSNLKEFTNAITYVDKALNVSPGNANAIVSKKYMRLGLANNMLNNKEYEKAEITLKENFINFKDDKETLLNLSNLYLISEQTKKAKETFLQLEKINKFTSLNGLSLVAHIDGNDKEALKISKSAIDQIESNIDKEIIRQTKERYIQALIWNKKFKDAEKEIQNLLKDNPKPGNWIYSLRATLNIYKSDFKKSISDYNLILEKDSASFDGNLGSANALKASGFYNKAYKSANNTLKFYNNQKDALQFIKKLDLEFTPTAEAKASYSFDNGNNKAYSYQLNNIIPLSTKLKILNSFGYRTTENNVTNLSASSKNASFGISYQLKNNITFVGNLGVTNSEADTNSFTQLLSDFTLNIKPFKLQNLSIGYKREIQNFNAELLDREIVMNNYILNYSLNTNFRLGWFSQYYYTSQNDGNARNLLFTSLYYSVLEKPSLKAGINYQYITFKNQVPTIYFSPETFNAVEIFFNIIKDENAAKEKSLYYELTAATGLQFIESDPKQSTYRIQGKLGYRFSERSILNLYGTQSNIASATAAGFTFTEFGVRFKWIFLRKPIYKKQMKD